MTGQRRWHAIRVELAAPWPQYPGDGQRRQSANNLNDAGTAVIEKPNCASHPPPHAQ